jgi:hypothetical protein
VRQVRLSGPLRSTLRQLAFGPAVLHPEDAAELETLGLVARDGDVAWLTDTGRAAVRDGG